MIRGIVAVDPALAIGRGSDLPWHHPEDLRFFKQQTTGSVVLMGRTTHESIGRPLPNRVNVVLSRGASDLTGVIVVRSVPDALALDVVQRGGDVYVIGGAQVYRAMAPHIQEWLVTRIPTVAKGADTFLPSVLFDGFAPTETFELGGGLTAERLTRTAH
jgi:dihydrofolate reductase